MTTVVQSKKPIVVPDSLRRRAGIKPGDRVEFKLSGGIISIIPELPSATGEHTPGKKRIIDARLAEARKGPYYGPFDTAGNAVKFLRKEIKTRKSSAQKTR